jgi:hypothetical protein
MKRSQENTASPNRTGIAISLVALLISAASLWDAHEARNMSYESSLPELSETTELLGPLVAGEPIRFKVTITNFGHTTAQHMDPTLKFLFAKSTIPFNPDYSTGSDQAPPSIISELAAGDHTSLISTSNVNLEHDHDVAAVLSGDYRFYIFGKIPYKDFSGADHEFHFCRLVTALVIGAEPLKPQKCPTFNYTS